MSSMLDDPITDQQQALVAALEQRIVDLEAELEQAQREAVAEVQLAITARSEATGLAQAVFDWSVAYDTYGTGAGQRLQNARDQMLLRTAELLGYEGMAQAAAERLAGQTVLL